MRCLAYANRPELISRVQKAQTVAPTVPRGNRYAATSATVGYRCVDCANPRDLTLDHLVPLALEVKRSYRDDELATRCRHCNSRRGNGFRREN